MEATTSDENINDNQGETTPIVVTEHSAYKSVEALVKGKKEADDYIKKQSEEIKALKAMVEQLKQTSNITEQLKQIRENTQMDTENTNTPDLPEDVIKQIALKAMQESEEAKEAESNLANCKQAVASINSDVELALKNKATELGCSVEYLEDIAKTSPKAFKSMFGLKEGATFDSINFLQGSRQTSLNPADTSNTISLKSAASVSDFVNKALKNPEVLANLKKW